MILDLSSVLSEPHRPIDTSVPVEMDVFQSAQGSFPLKEKSELHLLIEYEKERKLQISGKAEMTAVIPCDRCLKDVEVRIPLDFTKKISVDPEETEDSVELDETNYIDGCSLDVEQLVRNELLVGWPTKVLCSDDCKGICSVCGQNLNEGTCDCEDTSLDPRMSAIRDVFKNFKEV